MVTEDEYGPEIEICTNNTKERVHATWNTLTFKNISTRMIIEVVTGSARWINMLPPTDGIYIAIIPITLVTEIQINYKKNFRIVFRSYK